MPLLGHYIELIYNIRCMFNIMLCKNIIIILFIVGCPTFRSVCNIVYSVTVVYNELVPYILMYSASQRLSPGAKMLSCWKEKILPKIVTANAYVFSSYMNS